MEGAKYRTQISSSVSVLPPFLQGSPPSTAAPLPDSRGEVSGSPSASPPGFWGPCAPALQRSRPLREDRRTARAGRLQFRGRRCRPKGRLPSPIGGQLPPLYPKMEHPERHPESRRQLRGCRSHLRSREASTLPGNRARAPLHRLRPWAWEFGGP